MHTLLGWYLSESGRGIIIIWRRTEENLFFIMVSGGQFLIGRLCDKMCMNEDTA
jgi:hypothetical protein